MRRRHRLLQLVAVTCVVATLYTLTFWIAGAGSEARERRYRDTHYPDIDLEPVSDLDPRPEVTNMTDLVDIQRLKRIMQVLETNITVLEVRL